MWITLLSPPAFWTVRGHRVLPFSPPVPAFNFYREAGAALPNLAGGSFWHFRRQFCRVLHLHTVNVIRWAEFESARIRTHYFRGSRKTAWPLHHRGDRFYMWTALFDKFYVVWTINSIWFSPGSYTCRIFRNIYSKTLKSILLEQAVKFWTND